MQPQTADLSGLKDIHLPPLPPAWPPDPVVLHAAAAIVCAVALAAFALWFFRRATPRRYVLKELARLSETPDLPPADHAAAVLKLMRRAALTRYGRVGVADLSGRKWLDFLKERGAAFSPKAAEIVEYGAYLPPERISKEAADELSLCVKNWVVKL